ncbi:MAG: DMT family transporter [Prevotella sp.]|jgi:drug/metabolite transporter (DMT)-like permease|nr:DMT family transporter [Prevotella sp.]
MGNSGNKSIFNIWHLVALVIVIIWGCTLVSTKVLIQAGMSELEIFVFRAFIAYVAILFISPRKLWADSFKDELMMVLLGITGGSLYFISENMAVNYTYVNNVGFIASISPIVTTALVLLTYKGIPIRKILFVGSAIAVLGVAVVVLKGHVELHPKGDMLAILTMISFGVYGYFLKQMGNRYDSVFITRKMFVYGLLTALPLFIIYPWQFPLENLLDMKVLLNLLFLALIASFGCFLMWTFVVNKLGAVTSNNYIYLVPFSTVIFSALVLDEHMTAMSWIGCALIMLGVYMANIGSRD